MPIQFAQARQQRIFQDVVDQIQAAILHGHIAPGERLPPERELVTMFKTSRPTLREALRILEQKGLIEIRLGAMGGAFVRDANGELMAESLAMLIASQGVSLNHLAEFREGIEASVAGLAAARSTDAHGKTLIELNERIKVCAKQGVDAWPEVAQLDEQFHLETARIAGNPLYSFVLQSIHENLHRFGDTFRRIGQEELDQNLQDLDQLTQAICKHDRYRASRLARDHVRWFHDYKNREQ
jgi:DNA-binding FadR family transcriptional regulator